MLHTKQYQCQSAVEVLHNMFTVSKVCVHFGFVSGQYNKCFAFSQASSVHGSRGPFYWCFTFYLANLGNGYLTWIQQVLGKFIGKQTNWTPFYIELHRLPLPNVNDKLYSRNKKLVHSEKINELKIKNPKSITFDRQGKLYTGSIDGCVYCLSDDECDVVASFPNGRPLGVRISNDVLYIIEANSGLYALNLKTKDLKHLLGNYNHPQFSY